MKKEYVTPTAEKMEFDYTNVVVASGDNCRTGGEYSETGLGCKENWSQWMADVAH